MSKNATKGASLGQPTSPVTPSAIAAQPIPEAQGALHGNRPKKTELVLSLLAAEEGATIADLCHATGWQPHSCRAFFTGLRKKGCAVERNKRPDGTTVYKLVAASGADQ